ncbi:DUF7144 family membrane protein [Embleya scabrispora]|uniref:DUF7144 family membrane protein n=1 Tax=Embleya scabrispora TaxID=159449 RepID=UPI0003726C42|nr:hypothetical protein [Embleya scabrispora]MYS80465.1 hypothetical protein [Streptomyces sp. SID5474]
MSTHTGPATRSGWITFAAVLMTVGGALAVFQGIAGIAKDDVIVATRNYSFSFSTTGWGWIHLILGIVIFLGGLALFGGAVWARVLGVFLAGLSMVANFVWLPHYPVWSIVVIAIDVAIIWALCTGPSRSRS